jgi:4'-phosphopantetheinyl transferase EntD
VISTILPNEVVAIEKFGPLSGSLWNEETEALGHSISSRRVEFAAGRTCARDALRELGIPAQPILRGLKREPLWPSGIVGSITHCDRYCAAAVAHDSDIMSIGIDAEENKPLPDGVLNAIACEEEIRSLNNMALPYLNWDRLLFSAKESVYKAWYPVTGCWLGFEEALVTINQEANSFHVQLHPKNFKTHTLSQSHFRGRFIFTRGYVLTSVVIPRK